MPQTTIYVAPRLAGMQDTIPPAVAAEDLARLFGRSAALAGISLEIEMGRTVALLGPNGAGKTTLLRILATAIRPSFGTLAIDGLDALRYDDAVRSRVVYLPHVTGLYDDLTAEENLRFAATMYGWSAPEVGDIVRAALDEVGLLPVATDRVRTFSAGMRKRVALARLLTARPSMVLLDEPHAALDGDGMALVDRLLGRWHEVGITVIVASHQADRVVGLADATLRLDGGLVAEVTGSGIRADSSWAAPAAAPAAFGSDR
jgi:heme exporter protein A